MTTSTSHITPSPARRRAAARSAQEQLFLDTAGMRRWVVWRMARWIPDAAAAVDAAVWESISGGATDWQSLFDAARYGVDAEGRWESRQRRRPPLWVTESPDPAERVVEVVDAAVTVRQLLSTVRAPSTNAAVWLDRKVGNTGDGAMPGRVKTAGSRWAARARYELGARDEVA